MADATLALAALAWLEELGAPPGLVSRARDEMQVGGAVGTVPARIPIRIELSPGILKIAPGHTGQLTATRIFDDGPPEDASADVIWTSNSDAFHVDANGLVAAEEITGYMLSAKITATDPMARKSGFALVLWPGNPAPSALTVTPTKIVLGAEESVQFTATRHYEGGRTEDITYTAGWTSSQGIVTVSSGYATARGITGEQTAIITVTDPDAPLTATAEITVRTSHDVTLEVTPKKDKLAPGGSMRFKAERVSAGTRLDVTNDVTWTCSNPLVTIQNDGSVQAQAKATKSAIGTVTALDTATDLTATASLTVEVLSQEIATYPTPFGRIRYVDGYDGIVKPRLQNATQTFELAEKREDTLDAAYEALRRQQQALASAMAQVTADVRKNGKMVKPDANAAFHDELSQNELTAGLEKLDQNIADVSAHVKSARAAIEQADGLVHLHALQAEAKAFDEAIDITANASKVLVSIEDPVALVTALMDLSASLAKTFLNRKAHEADEAEKALDDKRVAAARQELADAEASGQAWAALRQKDVENLAARVRHAQTHWQAVEAKYDEVTKATGGFQFTKANTLLKAGDSALKSAADLLGLATQAEIAANDLLNFSPKPEVWLADASHDLDTLRILHGEAAAKIRLAKERQGEIAAILKTTKQAVQDGRAALLEGDANVP